MYVPATAPAPVAQSAAPSAPQNSIASAAPGGGRLRVMTWNIHFGGGNTSAQAQVIADSGADVVLLQEAQTWDEHMPTTYPQRLRQLTGQTWHAVWSAGSDCGSGCQGALILSRFPIEDSGSREMSGTTAGWAAINVGGVRVNVFNVHLEYYDTSKRSSQLQQFMDWSREFGGPRLAGGDFNSWWGEYWIRQMENEYSDTWQDVTGSDEDGYTLHGTVRFDYLFRSHDTGWRLTPQSSWVRWTDLSDHGALIADYTVR
jgi:endonuclease/exonuclease/phosphatase family metal-dependent hydrolase